MVEFYKLTQLGRSFVTLLFALCVPLQTLTTVISYYRRTRARLFETLLELFLLFHILVLSLPIGRAQLSNLLGLIVPTGYIELRYISATCVVLLACVVILYSKKAWYLSYIAVSCLTLPVMGTVFGNTYAWLYIIALLFWLTRGAALSITHYREIRLNISTLSVKDAVDSLHTGVLFSEQDGFIALVNVQMQRLMTVITGRIHRNARDFYDMLMSAELAIGCRKAEFEGQILYILPDETAWVFTRTEMQIENKRYIQLTATDITEQWALTAQLQQQEALLKLRGEELCEMIGGLQTLSRTREFQNAKLRAHDILGQRLTLLLHAVSSGQTPDYNLLGAQLESLLDDLKFGQNTSHWDRLDSFRRTFKAIGVKIHLNRDLPEDDITGAVFVDIISESVVNAVRHGFATDVFVMIADSGDGWYLEITDNGRAPSQPIVESGGIGGMRSKVEPRGGTLDVTTQPRFTLKIFLPGGETYV